MAVWGDNLQIQRRQLCLLLGASLFTRPVFATSSFSALDTGQNIGSIFLSAASNSNDEHWVSGFTLNENSAKIHFKIALPGRAHHIAVHAQRGVFVVVARRPGRYLLVGNLHTGKILQSLTVPENRHLFGHGVFSAAGDYFYTTESAYQDQQEDNGRVAVWRARGKAGSFSLGRLQDFSSHGVGPHELLLMPEQNALVIANGGIRTHPDSGREKLNLDSMHSSLVYLNPENGHLLEKHQLAEEFHQASIRHLDVNSRGQVVLGMQYQGEPFDNVPLVASHQRGQTLKLLKVPLSIQQQMQQYVGSIRFDLSGQFIAASCPRGNKITFWNAESGEYIESARSRDGCGVCATDDGFIFTAGTGRITHYNLLKNELNRLDSLNNDTNEKIFWDNHLTSASL